MITRLAFAVIAAIAFTGCGEDKAPEPTSPYLIQLEAESEFLDAMFGEEMNVSLLAHEQIALADAACDVLDSANGDISAVAAILAVKSAGNPNAQKDAEDLMTIINAADESGYCDGR